MKGKEDNVTTENPEVIDIVERWLREHGYDGLWSESGECSCCVGRNLVWCGQIGLDCRAGYRQYIKGSNENTDAISMLPLSLEGGRWYAACPFCVDEVGVGSSAVKRGPIYMPSNSFVIGLDQKWRCPGCGCVVEPICLFPGVT